MRSRPRRAAVCVCYMGGTTREQVVVAGRWLRRARLRRDARRQARRGAGRRRVVFLRGRVVPDATPVRLVGVVGDDFPDEHTQLLEVARRRPGGARARAAGGRSAGRASTRRTSRRAPRSTPSSTSSRTSVPSCPRAGPIRSTCSSPTSIRCCSSACSSRRSKPQLRRLRHDELLDRRQAPGAAEAARARRHAAAQRRGGAPAVRAGEPAGGGARDPRAWGRAAVVIKRGDAGALLFHEGGVFAAPAFPIEDVVDPTGAGDSFAGGFMGWLAREGNTSRRRSAPR